MTICPECCFVTKGWLLFHSIIKTPQLLRPTSVSNAVCCIRSLRTSRMPTQTEFMKLVTLKLFNISISTFYLSSKYVTMRRPFKIEEAGSCGLDDRMSFLSPWSMMCTHSYHHISFKRTYLSPLHSVRLIHYRYYEGAIDLSWRKENEIDKQTCHLGKIHGAVFYI